MEAKGLEPSNLLTGQVDRLERCGQRGIRCSSMSATANVRRRYAQRFFGPQYRYGHLLACSGKVLKRTATGAHCVERRLGVHRRSSTVSEDGQLELHAMFAVLRGEIAIRQRGTHRVPVPAALHRADQLVAAQIGS